MADGPPIERKTKRGKVRIAAYCRSATGLRDEGWLEDISSEGCRMTTHGTRFRVGSRVVIRPQGLEGVTGVVRWIDATKAGIEFDAPLYEPIVEHLWKTYGPGKPVPFTTS